MPLPPAELLATLYRELPFLVVHLTSDGVVLHANPGATALTGYEEAQLVGRNFWATLFPGKLFAQVPKYISSQGISPLLKDQPMTIRTRAGADRVIAFSRFLYGAMRDDDAAPRSVVLIGVDLTDRLLDTDKDALLETGTELPPIGSSDAATEDDLFAPAPPAAAPGAKPGEVSREDALRHVDAFLQEIDARLGALDQAVAATGIPALGALAQARPATAHHAAESQRLHGDAARSALAPIHALIQEVLALYGAQRP